jgi:hypothetical protein
MVLWMPNGELSHAATALLVKSVRIGADLGDLLENFKHVFSKKKQRKQCYKKDHNKIYYFKVILLVFELRLFF